jgi:hypothetical protein
MITLFILIVLVAIIFLWQVSNFISIFSGSVYVAARRDVILFALKKAGVRKNSIVYDLGSGNGDVLIFAHMLGARSYGVEISPFYYLLSLLRTFSHRDVSVIFGDIRKVNLKKADIVYCYLLPKFLSELKGKFEQERPKKIISIGFEIKGLEGKKKYNYKGHKIFIYSLSSRSV